MPYLEVRFNIKVHGDTQRFSLRHGESHVLTSKSYPLGVLLFGVVSLICQAALTEGLMDAEAVRDALITLRARLQTLAYQVHEPNEATT